MGECDLREWGRQWWERHPMAPSACACTPAHTVFSSGSHINLGEISKLNPLFWIPNVLCPVYYKIYNAIVYFGSNDFFLKGKNPTYDKNGILSSAQMSLSLYREPHHHATQSLAVTTHTWRDDGVLHKLSGYWTDKLIGDSRRKGVHLGPELFNAPHHFAAQPQGF